MLKPTCFDPERAYVQDDQLYQSEMSKECRGTSKTKCVAREYVLFEIDAYLWPP